MEYNIDELDETVRLGWRDILRLLQADGHQIRAVSLPTTRLALSAYYIIAPAEASSNLSKFDGVRYGTKSSRSESDQNVLFSSTRGNGFGEEAKRRILLGSYSLSAAAIDNYFIKAQKVRRLVQQDFNRVFALQHPLIENEGTQDDQQGVDVILCPTAPSLPPKRSSLTNRAPTDTYKDDVFTVPASLAGLPAMSVPIPISAAITGHSTASEPTMGLQIIAQYGDDDLVFTVGQILEDLVE